MFREPITTEAQLRQFIPPPGEPALRKQISAIDDHCRAFIERSPFMLLATSNAHGECDVSPKGDRPGFVQVLDEQRLVIPDRPGNQRANSLLNIIENPHVGLLFIIPGVEWTLRVNGGATIIRDTDMRERCAVDGKVPALAIAVEVREAYLHCPKCFIRAGLWDSEGWMPAAEQPSFASILRDQTRYTEVPVGVIEKSLEADKRSLY